MKKIAIATATSILLFSSPVFTNAASDIKGHYFEKDMKVLIDKGLLNGYSDGTYRPNREVTRAEFTIFLVRALDVPKTSKSVAFKDIKKGDWYYSDIARATQVKLIGGYPDGTFQPNKHISREEMAAITVRALHHKGIKTKNGKLSFRDLSKISPIYRSSIAALVDLNIMNGKGDGKGNRYFDPKSKTTRGETSAIINRVLKTIDNKPPAKQPETGVKEIIDYTTYSVSFSSMIDKQMAISPITDRPKVDGAGIYHASRSLVEYYANPNNFAKGTDSYLQFLLLSKPTGLHAKELNEKVLKGKGIFEGQGQAFIDAAKLYDINEVYLIAHALHETGNGTSPLATGYLVSEVDGKKVKPMRTYNMYGVGAYDRAPNKAGSEYAYKNEWFTPRAAIIGGAKFIADRFINRGQDTLYKMRWNPASPATRQYATHVAWADLQTKRMASIYRLLNSYTLHFDVPKFPNQPKSSKKPTGVHQYDILRTLQGKTGLTTTALNMRSGPTTGFSVVTTLPKATRVDIQGENGGWYYVNAGGATGWVSGNYIELLLTPFMLYQPIMATEEKTSELEEINENIEEKTEEVIEDPVIEHPAEQEDVPAEEESIPEDTLTEEQDEVESDIILDRLFGKVTGDNVLLRTEASDADDTSIVTTLELGTTVEIIEYLDGWYFVQTEEHEGWILESDLLIQ